MGKVENIKNKSLRTKKLVTIALFVTLLIYFIYNVLSGDRGVLSLFKVTERFKVLEQEVTILENEKQGLEKKVESMRSESLDLDLLDEEVRKNLGYSNKNETLYVEE